MSAIGKDGWWYSIDPCGGWYWHHSELPSGWSPGVSDWSQSKAPRSAKPEYDYFIASSSRIICLGREDTLAEAKRKSLLAAATTTEHPDIAEAAKRLGDTQ